MNGTRLICGTSTFFFPFLNLPLFIFTYLTHSIRIVLEELQKLGGATRLGEAVGERSERLTVDQALAVGSGVGAPVFNTTVYITRGDGVTGLVVS